jgi:hypothetical protein
MVRCSQALGRNWLSMYLCLHLAREASHYLPFLDQVILGTVVGAVLGFYITFSPVGITKSCWKASCSRTS